METNPKTIITHSGTFHTDDLFAVATVSLYIESVLDRKVQVIRARDEVLIRSGDFVVDVGEVYDEDRERFDHHQEGGAGARQNGIPYAAFGLVWKKYGGIVAGLEESARRIEERLVFPVDAHDNGMPLVELSLGIAPYLIQDGFSSFIPNRGETVTTDEAFSEALVFARRILEREIVRVNVQIASEIDMEIAYQTAQDKRLIIFNESFDWGSFIGKKSEPLYVVEPQRDSQGGFWKLSAVRTGDASFDLRSPLPASWAGKRGQELASLTGVSDSHFCHNKRFLAVARSREGALSLARLALQAS